MISSSLRGHTLNSRNELDWRWLEVRPVPSATRTTLKSDRRLQRTVWQHTPNAIRIFCAAAFGWRTRPRVGGRYVSYVL